jgi:hypothetical protein
MTNTEDFKSFDKILHIGKLYMTITQKIHGSNAQLLIYKDEDGNLQHKAGSRTRWLDEIDDNYGFAKFCKDHREELIGKLGEGRHYGEWAGPGINLGEGLKEKTLCLFNWRRWIGKELPTRVTTVPMLYKGAISLDAINEAMDKLKAEGSMLVPGYMKPEGVVIDIDGQLYKNVFDEEQTKWREKTKTLCDKEEISVMHLLQPIRLDKLLSRNESYTRDYPQSLSRICRDYVQDLEDEKQFHAENEDDLKKEKKALGKQIFYFVKAVMLAR